MTSIFISFLNCSVCGEARPFERYDRIDVSKTAQFRELIIDWELFKSTCTHCGHQVIIDYPTLYVDEENKVIIRYLPSNHDESSTSPSESLLTDEIDMSKYEYRVVTNLEDFIEKVQIFSEGFDDRAIEVMKYQLSPKEEEDIQFSYEHMVFTKVGPANYQFMFMNHNEAVASLTFSEKLYSKIKLEMASLVSKDCYINDSWAERFVRHGLSTPMPQL